MHAINAANKQTQRSNKQFNQKLSENMTIRMVYTLNKPLADEYTTQAHCTANLYHKQIKQSNATTHVRANPHPLDVLTPCLHAWTKETIIWPNVLLFMETSWPLWKRKPNLMIMKAYAILAMFVFILTYVAFSLGKKLGAGGFGQVLNEDTIKSNPRARIRLKLWSMHSQTRCLLEIGFLTRGQWQ